jgi:transposase
VDNRRFADAFRGRVSHERGAEAHIEANPSRAIKAPPDPDLYAERHEVEGVFQRIEGFRRIALRCEKTRLNFMGFVFIVSARDRLG